MKIIIKVIEVSAGRGWEGLGGAGSKYYCYLGTRDKSNMACF